MEYMPKGRTMLDGTLLPDGTVVFMNGANKGAQGYAEPAGNFRAQGFAKQDDAFDGMGRFVKLNSLFSVSS